MILQSAESGTMANVAALEMHERQHPGPGPGSRLHLKVRHRVRAQHGGEAAPHVREPFFMTSSPQNPFRTSGARATPVLSDTGISAGTTPGVSTGR